MVRGIIIKMDRRKFLKDTSLLTIFSTGYLNNEEGITDEKKKILKSIIEVLLPVNKMASIDERIRDAENLLDKLNIEKQLYIKTIYAVDLSPFFYGRFKRFRNMSLIERRQILNRLESRDNPLRGFYIWFKDITFIIIFSENKLVKLTGWKQCRGL